MTTEQILIRMAYSAHSDISPVGKYGRLEDGITEIDGKKILWYNDAEGSTHIVTI